MRKFLSVLLSVLLFSGALPLPMMTGTALALDPPARQISFSSANQEYPAISGDNIVWQDARKGNWDIYLYNRATYAETRVTTDTAAQAYPAISGDKIVWQDHRNGKADIYLYDLTSQKERRVTTDTADQGYPAISGDKIVWQDHRNGNSDVYLYDLLTSKERRITTNSAGQGRPAISGNKIVWEDYRNGNADIYLYDLLTGQERRITSDSADQKQPAISGSKIVWTDFRNGNADIYLYDLTTNKERQITADVADQEMPKISANRIVWQDHRNGNFDVYKYNLNVNQESRVTSNDSNQMLPAISGDRIVWEDYRSGNPKIFLSEAPTWLPDTEAPSAPADLAVVPSLTGLKLSWVASEDNDRVASYKVERATDPAGKFELLATCSSEAYTDTTTATSVLLPNTRYYYQVRAVDARGNTSTYSNMANGIIDTQAPTAPTYLGATRLGGSLILSWGSSTDTVGVSGYSLERSTDQTNWKPIGKTQSPTRSLVDANLTSDTLYYYRVKAFDAQANYSGASKVIQARTFVQTSVMKEEADPYFKWSGGSWVAATNASCSGGADRSTSKSGSALEVVFRGTRVSWLGTTAADKGIAKVYIDGRLVKTVDQYSSATAYKQTLFTASGLTDTAHVLKIEATGTRRAAATAVATEVDAIKIEGYCPGINVEQSLLSGWTGSWSSTSGEFYSGGSVSCASSANASVEFTFYGTSISWIGTRAVNRGIATVYIDGASQGNVDQYATGNIYQQALFSKSGLVKGVHKVKIVATGTKRAAATDATVDMDGLIVK